MTFLLRGLLSFLILISSTAWAASLSLRDVIPSDAEELKKQLPRLFEPSPDMATMDEAIRILVARGTYENVFLNRIRPGVFEILGKPLRTVEGIRFLHVEKVKESDLRDLLDFKVGDRFDRKRAVAAGERMKNYYGEHGYFNTVIEVGFEKSESGNIRLVFDVTENTPCVVKGIKFDVANTDLKKLLRSGFKNMLNKPLTSERIRRFNQDLNALLVDHRYLAAEINGPDAEYNGPKTEAVLTIQIREPNRYEFYFSGNHFFTDADVWHSLDLANRERKNVDPAGEGSERLRRAYLEAGFPNVQIETDVVNPEQNYLRRVYYSIHEGARVRIKDIEIQGRVTRAPAYYKDFILHNSSDLIGAGFYNRTGLETGFKNLVTDLRNQGFLRARVQSSRIEYTPNKKEVVVYLLLDEGPQTQIRGLEFVGNKFFSSFELAKVSTLETNTPLHLTEFESSLNKLKRFYHDQGFLEMKLLNENQEMIQYNDKGTQARIRIQIYEGPRIRIQSIVVEGNVQTKPHVILTEADFRIGEVLTPQKLDDATIRLNKLGLFSRVNIHTLEENTNVSERTLVISVSEVDPGVFRFGGGVTSERNFTARGFTGANYNNLWGTARGVSGRAELRENITEVRYPETEVTAGYLEPFLFNTRTRGRVNLTRSQYVADYEDQYTQITIKNRLDLFAERDLTNHTKFVYKVYSLESREDFERFGRCLPDPNNPEAGPAPPGSPYCSPNTLQVSTVGPQLNIDYRDNPFLPTRGSFTKLTVDYSNPNLGSSKGVEFIRLDAAYTYYTNIYAHKWIWANSIHGGYLSNLSRQADSGVPSDYAFVLGGIYTLRGFDIASPNERVPKDGDDGWHLGETNEKLIHSDSNYVLVKTEMRFPIYGDFGGVFFYDGGAVHVSGYSFSRPYRDAVGFGFRYNTPVGPVALDFAFKIDPEGIQYNPDGTIAQQAEAPFRLEFSIGTF